jgi:signal transduction histidine kinase
MKLKAFLSSYLLFLCVLFVIIATVSTYMSRSQINMLRDKSTREFQTISASLTRDMAVAFGNTGGFNPSFDIAFDTLFRGYARYYGRYGIELSLAESREEQKAEISFTRTEQGHFIRITGTVRVAERFYRLDYYLNITENINDLRNIQLMLLSLALLFSALTAFGLYIILLRIFKPIGIVANSSKNIANGNYDERIHISGSNELSAMAANFNKMAEEIEVQIVGKQQFIDNFTHEIRSPLTSIYGYAEYLQKAPYGEDTTIKATQTIMDEANHIKMIAASLLKLATLRNYTPVKTKISIPRLFDDVCRMLNTEKNLVRKNEIDTMEGQEDLIKSLLTNLCTNAIRAGATDIYLEAAESQGGGVVLSVTDNGCGISSDDLTRITEPFYRVDKARNREQGGAGLGLTLCKQIAEAHGAVMHIESILRNGTSVKITFTTP